MEDCKSATPTLEGEEDLIAAAQQIVIALESRRNLTSDARKILVDLGTKLSSVTKLSENKKEDVEDGWLGEIEERLNIIQDKVMNWEVEESMICDCGSEEAYDYVKAVDEAQKLTETLESLCLDRDGEESELLRRAYDVVHTAMVRLEEDFRRMLVQKRQLFEREDVSFRSSKGDVENEGSVMSFGDELFVSFRSSIEDPENKGPVSSFWDILSGSSSEDSIIHLVHPSVIPDLKYIAKLMFDSNHDQECRQAFISVQKDALNNRLFMLEVDKLRIDDVLKMEWGNLDSQIRRWIWVMKIFVRVYLASEKRLSDQIFGGFDSCSSICFVEASKSSMLQLLNFGEAIAIGPCQPEKLVCILGMYEMLADLIPDIDALYTDEIDSCVKNECQDLLRRLGYCVKATFLEFENLVASNTSTTPFPEGGIHHLTRYLINYIRTLTDYSETLNLLLKDSGKEISDVVHTAMVRLEEEFRCMLVQKRQLFEREDVSFRSSKGDVENEGSVMSFGDESFVSFRSSIEDPENKGSVSSFWDSLSGSSPVDSVIHLVHPSVIPDLKCIAKLMFDSNHDQECRQAFISVQKDALNNRLFMLEVDKLRIDDVLKMECGNLDSQIRRWIWVMKIFVRVYLASEKRLSDQIFGGFDSCSSICFVEASKSSMLQLLNFGKAIAVGPHQPEKLVCILGMYETLADLIPDIDALYTNEIDSCVRNECQDLLRRLGYCVKATFLEFGDLIASNPSTTPFPGGGIHHLTSYVMNYIRTLTDYSETLNLLLKDSGKEISVSFSPDLNPTAEDNSSMRSSSCVSPTALHFQSLISILLCNLDDKSKLYKEDSLSYLFLMNNIHYVTQKVKDSELKTILGDEWIRTHNREFQQQAMNYERATWSSILSLLRDEGISVSRTLLKERMQSFYVALEEVYKIQTAWLIPDIQLRQDLRISISVKVIQAYRSFVGRHGYNLSDKSIKYSADDLESYLLDLFEGSPKSLRSRDPQNHCTFATDIEGPCMS